MENNIRNFVMSDELSSFDQRAVIKVCGVGGGGGNAVQRMIEDGLRDVDFITINTDAQALKKSPSPIRLQIGAEITNGLGSGARPEIGEKAAMEDRERLDEVLRGADMVFVTAGLGGGTGTGAAPLVAELARASGALTVGIVTLPFSFEGNERMENALKGLENLEPHVDTLIVVPNDRVAMMCQENVSLMDAFKRADEVLHNGVRAISELITVPGLINLDFADVRTVMHSRGRALMGIGIAEGADRAVRAAEEAIVCPLLEQSSIQGATAVIANVKGGRDVGMREVQDAVSTVQRAAHPDANIIFGAVIDDEERPELQVTVIAAGFSADSRSIVEQAAASSIVRLPVSGRMAEQEASEQEQSMRAVVNGNPDSGTPGGAKEAAPAQEMDFLFPPGEVEAKNAFVRDDIEEDISVPAFMRKKRGK